MDRVLYDLEHTPYSRRIMTNMYTFSDLGDEDGNPCRTATRPATRHRAWPRQAALNMVLMQRSQDILAANN